ncbi:aminotransferase class IV [Plantactinospora sp. KBS50]|uniref:aminotransferase class IV n=1 Tax=Plantactinospora sp. KBS50 TaxID=2024580 RepID=UPI000BAB0B3D|nr:aminotransferase class IV [Plantactinospora sp. KBS50]ASW56927.1 aminotransferase IV [Plantactinospora sp. KBS50]
MSGSQVVAVLGRGLVPAGEPVVRADDRGLLGDGLFETLHVRDGQPWLVAEHLARLATGAAAMDLPLPPVAELVELLATACARWPAGIEGTARLTCTRGPADGTPAVAVVITTVPPAAIRARRDGVTVRTLPLGVTATARRDLPWLLAGQKTLAAAVNAASRRWAAANGVDDALWVSTDGYALEAPSANVVWLDGDTLCTVPAGPTGVLPGVTAAWLLAHAGELGWAADERMTSPGDLRAATGGAWLTSSGRGLAEIRRLDGIPLPPSKHTDRIRTLLGFPAPAPAA